MRGYAIAAEKSFGQVWGELTKKGWSFRKSLGLSDDRRYLPPGGSLMGTEGVDYFLGDTSLMNYCRRQGWLEFDPLPPTGQADLTEPETAVAKPAPKPRAAAKSTQVPPEAAAAAVLRLPCAEAKPSSPVTTVATISNKPITKSSAAKKPATKSSAKKPSAKRCASKRPASASSGSEPARRKRAAVGKTKTTTVQDSIAAAVPDRTDAVPDLTDIAIPDVENTSPDTAEERVPGVTTTNAEVARGGGTTTGRSLFDAFDSDDFLDALRGDRLFGPLESDDLNVGEADWLLGLDSDLEGDEESILHDEDNNAELQESDTESVEEDTEVSVDEVDEEPVTFELGAGDLDRLQKEEWDYFDERHSGQVQVDAAPLYDGPSGPTKAALAYAENPLAIFYFFLPKELWRRIAADTNKYRLDSVDEVMRRRALEKRLTTPSTTVLSVEEYRVKLRRKNSIQPHEIVRFIGLLIARALEPRRESLTRHWITQTEGALSRGTFGQFLSRDRFQDIARYLHFNDNDRQSSSGDRAFKIRPVVQALQKTFFRGYRLGARISFDEGMVPMRHRRNPMRQYLSNKPNKWGTMFYMTCCAETAYCSRIDIYCGKADKDETAVAQKAVVVNLQRVLQGQPAQRLVCTDNYYTSIPLSHKLLAMGHMHVGTIRSDRKGWCKKLEFKQKRRPQSMPRGTFRIAQWRRHPEFIALNWMDNKPVHFLATGCSTQLTHVTRREPGGAVSRVPCPQLVKDYHEAMGGVDVHDQLRLQRYSIQRSIRMRKYYKTLFIGLVDIAMVNTFIVHKLALRKIQKPVPTHAVFMRRLHAALLGQTSEDFAGNNDLEELVTQPLPRAPHTLQKLEEKNKAKTKNRQWLCKVCSAFAGPGVRSFETSYFCAACTRAKRGRVSLCNKARRLDQGCSLTCDQIWHQTWRNGTAIPPEYQDKIRFIEKRRPEVCGSDSES